jgi:protein-S-isoprenylcysteine O-methyltransferase Ste14
MDFDIILPSVGTLWVVSEISLVLLRRAGKTEQNRDQGSMILLNIVIYSAVAGAIVVGMSRIGRVPGYHNALALIGLALIILGLAVRWTAILTLRKFFTTNVAIHADHRIVTSGLYAYVRHPSYTGALISFAGLGLAFANWLSFLILIVPITFAFLKRINIEEHALRDHFGDAYALYSERTRKLFPSVY